MSFDDFGRAIEHTDQASEEMLGIPVVDEALAASAMQDARRAWAVQLADSVGMRRRISRFRYGYTYGASGLPQASKAMTMRQRARPIVGSTAIAR